MYSSIKLSASPNNDATSHVSGIRVTATWRRKTADTNSKDKKKDANKKKEEKYEYFPKYFDVENTNSFNIQGLRHNQEYKITLAYTVDLDGSTSVASEPVSCTTAATSAPRRLEITRHHSTNLTVQWVAPQYTGVEDAAPEDDPE